MDWTPFEGIFLRIHPYGEKNQIGTVYTPSHGKIALFTSFSRRKSPYTPLSEIEGFVREGRNDLYSAKDLVVNNLHLALRASYPTLETAANFCRWIDVTQMPGSPSPHLYSLLKQFLYTLKDCLDPQSLKASFQMKLLRHEGHLALPWNLCSLCQTPTSLGYFSEGAFYCEKHPLGASISLSPLETEVLTTLLYSRSTKQLSQLIVPDGLTDKVEQITLALYKK